MMPIMAKRPFWSSTLRRRALGLFRQILGAARELKGVPEVENQLVGGSAALDRGGVAGLAAFGVMHVAFGIAGTLAVGLEHADESDNLQLAEERDVVPLLLGRAVRDVAAVGQCGVLTRHEGCARGDEAEHGSHGHAAVLDLRMPEPADVPLLRFEADAREGRRISSEIQWIPVARWARQRIL